MTEKENFVTEFKTKKEEVEFLLEKYPATRENDFYLQLMWLKIFGHVNIPYIDWNSLKDFSGTLETVSRVRRKIQNEYGKYLPSKETQKQRLSKRKVITQHISVM
jgi:hypothetical protein